VIIRAAPGDIWPWLVQMGQGRGGFYSYDWLENLFRLGIHNAERILPEYQRLEVGGRIPLSKDTGLIVHSLEPGRSLVLAGSLRPGSDRIGGSWAFVLEPMSSQVTRLVVRRRAWLPFPGLAERAFSLLLLEPAHFALERKMLQGIQARAEAHRSPALLLDEFLPQYDFTEIHQVAVRASAEQVYRGLVKELRPEELSPLIYRHARCAESAGRPGRPGRLPGGIAGG